MLRYIGGSLDHSGLEAAISVSNPFDVLATTVKLEKTMFGLYGMFIRKKL